MLKTLPNYPQYQTDGIQVISKSTGKPVGLKKGTGKYYLLNKRGARKLVPPSEIFQRLFDEPIYKVGDKFTANGLTGVITRFTTRGNKNYIKFKCDDGYHFKRVN